MKQKVFNRTKALRFKRFSRKAYSAFNSMGKVVNHGVIVGCVLACLHTTANAQIQMAEANEKEPSKVMEQELDEVTVTASRVATPLLQASRLVTVVTKEQIARSTAESLQDILVYAANIDVMQRGVHGVQADISIRGGSTDQMAILLNGVNLTNSQTGHYNLDFPINLSDIERIEILQGPSTLIYGANAFSGGINIITKKEAHNSLYARIEAGMHHLKAIEARGSLRTGIATTSLSAGHTSSNGYTANSDYRLDNILLQTRLTFSEDAKLDLTAGYNDKRFGANTFYSAKFPNQYEETASYTTTLKGEFGDRLKVVPILYWNRHDDKFDIDRNAIEKRNYHRNDIYGGNLILQYSSSIGVTGLGAELRKETIMSSVLGYPMQEPHRNYKKYDARTNTSVTLEHTAVLNQWTLSAGVMIYYTSFRDEDVRFFPSAAVAYRPSDHWKLTASWGKAIRIPTFTDLTYTQETHTANDLLKPETSESVDVGIDYQTSCFHAYLNGYLFWGKQVIDWLKEPDVIGAKWTSWNHPRINTQGIEMGVDWYFGQLAPVLGKEASLSVSYSRMHQSGSDTQGMESKYIKNYLRDKLTARLHHSIYKGFSADWAFRVQKRMGTYEVFENLVETGVASIPGYATMDLKLMYTHNKLKLFVNLNNLFNRSYFDFGSIPQPGFWLTGGVSYRW